VIEGGETDIGLESTVLDVSSRPFRIYRPGAVSQKQIEDVVGEQVKMDGESSDKQAARSPGTKYSHYSPKAAVKWLDNDDGFDSKNTLYLLHTLSPSGAELPLNSENVIFFDRDYKRMA